MISVALSDHRDAVRSNCWSTTGTGGVRSMTVTNAGSSGSVVPCQPRSGCSVAPIGILGNARPPVPWSGSTAIITSRALKSP